MEEKMRTRSLLSLFAVIALMMLGTSSYAGDQPAAVYGRGANQFSLATGSPGELGLLKVLAEAFGKQDNAKMAWFKAGSGESLKLLKDKKVDMIMVHAPVAEKQAVQDGWATKRSLIGSNEFFIVGPGDDPAKIAETKSAVDAYRRVAAAKARFFSRGDNSGTHKKEMDLWKKAEITPQGDWYVVTKDFMTATLKRANQEKGYFMVDSSTWVADKKDVPDLKILFKGDKLLVNTYHALCQPSGATPGAATAAKFIDFVASPQGQKIIRDYGKNKYGEGLYNDAAYAKKYDD
ncbi:MAG TPA: substrate-binding domain-containing protein, partial [Desulfobaccales bacterium]|nr:substrate-binding domain-containing protein [Desulfobaccales bacterium]